MFVQKLIDTNYQYPEKQIVQFPLANRPKNRINPNLEKPKTKSNISQLPFLSNIY
jgi:hypothetical protein